MSRAAPLDDVVFDAPFRRFLDEAAPARGPVELHAVEVTAGPFASMRFAQDLEVELGKIEFRLFGWALLGWTVTADGPWSVRCEARFKVCERDHGEPARLHEGDRLPVQPMEPREILERARAMIRRAVLHEVDELLYVGDARPFDPHAGGG